MPENKLRNCLTITFLLLLQVACSAQQDSIPKQKKRALAVGFGVLYTGSMVGLNELWYKDFERSPLHSFDDSREWMGMDKAGHATTAYQIGAFGHSSMRWAGYSEKKSTLVGGSIGFAYLLGIEFLDGKSAAWGWSWSDIGANALGTGAFIGQQLLWEEQRFILKFSYKPSDFAQYRPSLLGSSWNERIFKDYNAQTYWVSTKVGSFGKNTWWPKWLMLSFGYSADGMLGANSNPLFDDDGTPLPQFQRFPQYLFSFDIDFQHIPIRRPWVRKVLGTFGIIKIAAPALELSNGKFTFHPFY
ncbi:MAG: DUF2279 domain-containing protein [Flavobacteriales bacterium]|nr:DUF2279 domain-containing protein [Flavobacteriales bacterium]